MHIEAKRPYYSPVYWLAVVNVNNSPTLSSSPFLISLSTVYSDAYITRPWYILTVWPYIHNFFLSLTGCYLTAVW